MPITSMKRCGLRMGRLEAPLPDGLGGIHFTDLAAGVFHWQAGRLTHAIVDRPMVGGLARTRERNLVASGPAVDVFDIRRGGSGEHVGSLLTTEHVLAKRGSQPWFNDIAFDDQGRLWCGVIRRNSKGTPIPGELYVYDMQGNLSAVHTDIFPNGIAFSADGGTAYCSDTFRRRILTFDTTNLSERGQIDLSKVPRGYPDGLAFDLEGHLWVAMWQSPLIVRISQDGIIDQLLDVGAWAYSLAFEPSTSSTLWVTTGPDSDQATGSGDLLRMDVATRGLAAFDGPQLTDIR